MKLNSFFQHLLLHKFIFHMCDTSTIYNMLLTPISNHMWNIVMCATQKGRNEREALPLTFVILISCCCLFFFQALLTNEQNVLILLNSAFICYDSYWVWNGNWNDFEHFEWFDAEIWDSWYGNLWYRCSCWKGDKLLMFC